MAFFKNKNTRKIGGTILTAVIAGAGLSVGIPVLALLGMPAAYMNFAVGVYAVGCLCATGVLLGAEYLLNPNKRAVKNAQRVTGKSNVINFNEIKSNKALESGVSKVFENVSDISAETDGDCGFVLQSDDVNEILKINASGGR